MAVKCPKCQAENPETKQFCGDCGTQLIPAEGPYASKTLTLETKVEGLARGTVFAERYEILEGLGTGGMGSVYRVYDRKLEEEVALKLIRPEIAVNRKALERFKNELKVARKIAHKSICKMYDLGESGGTSYITMEYVGGEDLRSVIHRMGTITMSKAVSIAQQVAEGLAEAHKLGIIHRDLKPGNIMIDKEGNAKIMDFGIARSLLGKGLTGEGAILGTPEYMSPEQVEGKEADQRADIYSLGIVLYEMLIGRPPFEGDTAFSIALKHKNESPENPMKLNPQIPEDLSRLILKCLEKNRDDRYQGAAEVVSELTRVEQGLPTTEKAVPKRKAITSREITVRFSLRKIFIPALALVVIVAVVIPLVFLRNKQPSKQPILPSHKQLTFAGDAYFPAISPDGKSIAYVTTETSGEQKVMVQDIASGQALEVFRAKLCLFLNWTPDGSELSFLALMFDSSRGMFIVSRLGGTPRRLEAGFLFSWSPDGSKFAHAVRTSKEIQLRDKSTGSSASLPLKGSFIWLEDIDWSPSGNKILFSTRDDQERYAIWTITPDGSAQQKVVEDNVRIFSPRWSPRGNAVYYLRAKEQTKELWKIPISSDTGKPMKSPSLILSGLQIGDYFTMTRDGKQLLYTRELQYSNLWLAEIMNRGKDKVVETKPLTTGTLLNSCPSISPDDRDIAFSRGNSKSANIFIMPLQGDAPKQITFLDSYNTNPVWSPDGREIAFCSTQGGAPEVWKMSASSGNPYRFAGSQVSSVTFKLVWSPGQKILYQRPGHRNFYVLNPDSREENPLVKDDSVGWNFEPKYSPDGKKIVVNWNRGSPSGSSGLWLISLDDSSQRLLLKGRNEPIGWSSDGKWVYFKEQDTAELKIFMVSVENGQVKTLSTIPATSEMGQPQMPCLTSDGRKFVFECKKTLSDVWVVKDFDPEVK